MSLTAEQAPRPLGGHLASSGNRFVFSHTNSSNGTGSFPMYPQRSYPPAPDARRVLPLQLQSQFASSEAISRDAAPSTDNGHGSYGYPAYSQHNHPNHAIHTKSSYNSAAPSPSAWIPTHPSSSPPRHRVSLNVSPMQPLPRDSCPPHRQVRDEAHANYQQRKEATDFTKPYLFSVSSSPPTYTQHRPFPSDAFRSPFDDRSPYSSDRDRPAMTTSHKTHLAHCSGVAPINPEYYERSFHFDREATARDTLSSSVTYTAHRSGPQNFSRNTESVEYIPSWVCRDFRREGICPRGQICRFYHVGPGEPLPEDRNISSLAPQNLQGCAIHTERSCAPLNTSQFDLPSQRRSPILGRNLTSGHPPSSRFEDVSLIPQSGRPQAPSQPSTIPLFKPPQVTLPPPLPPRVSYPFEPAPVVTSPPTKSPPFISSTVPTHSAFRVTDMAPPHVPSIVTPLSPSQPPPPQPIVPQSGISQLVASLIKLPTLSPNTLSQSASKALQFGSVSQDDLISSAPAQPTTQPPLPIVNSPAPPVLAVTSSEASVTPGVSLATSTPLDSSKEPPIARAVEALARALSPSTKTVFLLQTPSSVVKPVALDKTSAATTTSSAPVTPPIQEPALQTPNRPGSMVKDQHDSSDSSPLCEPAEIFDLPSKAPQTQALPNYDQETQVVISSSARISPNSSSPTAKSEASSSGDSPKLAEDRKTPRSASPAKTTKDSRRLEVEALAVMPIKPMIPTLSPMDSPIISTVLEQPVTQVGGSAIPASAKTAEQEICRQFLKGRCIMRRCKRLHLSEDELKTFKANTSTSSEPSAVKGPISTAVARSQVEPTSTDPEVPIRSMNPTPTPRTGIVDQTRDIASSQPPATADVSVPSKRRDLTARELDRICKNHLHCRCWYSLCHRKHVPRETWHEYYDRKDLCPLGEECDLSRCLFKQKPAQPKDSTPPPITTTVESQVVKDNGLVNAQTDRSATPPLKRPKKKLGKTESLETVSSDSSVATTSTRPTSPDEASLSLSSATHLDAGSSHGCLTSGAKSTVQPAIEVKKSSLVVSAPSKSDGLKPIGKKQIRRRKKSADLDRLVDQLEKSAGVNASSNPISSEEKTTPLLPPGLTLHSTTQSPSVSDTLTTTVLTFTVFDASRVTFGPGFDVKNLMTGFESQDIVIKNVPAIVTADAVRKILQPFGEVTSLALPDHRKDVGPMTIKASFGSYTDAAAAVGTLDGAEVFDRKLEVVLATKSTGKAIVQDGDVCLEFPSPSRTAFAGFASRALAEAAIASAAHVPIVGEIYDGLPNLGQVNVRFQGLDPASQASDVKKLGNPDAVMMGNFNYRKLETALEQLYDKLESFGDLESLDVLPPPYSRGLVRAWARFRNPKTAEHVCTELNHRPQRFIGNSRLSAHHQRSLRYKLPLRVYQALAFDVGYLRYCAVSYVDRCNVVVVNKARSPMPVVEVRLVAQDHGVLTKLKASFEGLLRGDRIMEQGNRVWDPYFGTHYGTSFLDELEAKLPGLVVMKDYRARILSLLGPPGRRQQARQAILAKVEELRSRTYKKFSLKSGLVGLFMSEDLAKLQQELGTENVSLDLSEKTLTVRGNEEAFKAARLTILSAQRRHPEERKPNDRVCPVCFDDPSSPVTLSCGHSWCKSCLSDYLMASVNTRVFPLSCLGSEARCTHHITLQVAREILLPSQFEAVTDASYLAYIHRHASEFNHCPTPDCPQIYRSAPRGTILRCPSCLVRICADCNREQHSGLCRYTESEDLKLFEEWTKDHDVKKCPTCKAPIERSAGCNHMTCTRCKTHICWVCMATFTSGDDVYDHMHATHGGIGL